MRLLRSWSFWRRVRCLLSQDLLKVLPSLLLLPSRQRFGRSRSRPLSPPFPPLRTQATLRPLSLRRNTRFRNGVEDDRHAVQVPIVIPPSVADAALGSDSHPGRGGREPVHAVHHELSFPQCVSDHVLLGQLLCSLEPCEAVTHGVSGVLLSDQRIVQAHLLEAFVGDR